MTEADAHIVAQERLRALVTMATGELWNRLPGHNQEDVDTWLTAVVPVVQAAQRQSVALTDAFLARRMDRPALGVDADWVIDAIRGTVTPQEVYRRPFVTVWTALKAGRGFDEAVNAGLARATSTAATDVQLAMRQTLVDIGDQDDLILGYQRVPDTGACAFCRLVAGQRYRTNQLMPIHAHCGCGVDVITAANRADFTGKAANDLSVTRDGVTAEVREHGELGPVLVDGQHEFTTAP